MESKLTSDEARSELLTLLKMSGREHTELLLYMEELERKCSRLEEENKRFKESAARRAAASNSMNSRLKDALRE